MKPIIDTSVLPAVGVLHVLYPESDVAWSRTAFVSSPPNENGKQRIATSFHNVRPLKSEVLVFFHLTTDLLRCLKIGNGQWSCFLPGPSS